MKPRQRTYVPCQFQQAKESLGDKNTFIYICFAYEIVSFFFRGEGLFFMEKAKGD